jgi:hypothetical protein
VEALLYVHQGLDGLGWVRRVDSLPPLLALPETKRVSNLFHIYGIRTSPPAHETDDGYRGTDDSQVPGGEG